ncbi:hypothetical protein P43SY_003338 [Pythium insidiosum]|uniref:Uncharacterized protein n=1 Tax=Pythium insidiosum TaxID=114742 RepID=A0AAD5LAN5_PYTIN|nr:hypothetical protein P43SY_003338 [Pythium insidiosum]KAJ0398149.1 hypothetical protein ATCC90586_004268 [Pythium insidiosum]
MSSCLMTPLPVVSSLTTPRLLKRPRSTTEDAMSLERILKAHKRSPEDSPYSSLDNRAWPVIESSETIKCAITFLRDSRAHAVGLLTQNQWQRAVVVLEKVERATDMVSRQRRKHVIAQANSVPVDTTDDHLRPRKVRFCEDVLVADAGEADRAPAPVPPFVREELLILRASRSIPVQNFSELWN